MPDIPLITVQIVVRNGAAYIRHCLDAVFAQSYPNVEIIVLDNASEDGTADIVAREYPRARLFRHTTNLGMWSGQEYLLALTSAEYICALSVDVIIDRDFLRAAITPLLQDARVGAVQGKIYAYDLVSFRTEGTRALKRNRIDTCGFGVTAARRVINIGHGSPDGARFGTVREIFGVEGAVPLFRRSALMACIVEGTIWDRDYFWYGDDFDLAWRMRLFGFRHIFVPTAIAWHDRSTTKGAAATPVVGQLARLRDRRRIPLAKRRLDWSNVRFTIVKNDFILNILRDSIPFLLREMAVFVYSLIFEPGILKEYARFFRLLPTMLRRRRLVMARAVVSADEIHRWFHA